MASRHRHTDPDAPAGGGGPGRFRVARPPGTKFRRAGTRRPKISLVIFPGESVVHHTEGGGHDVTMGHIYVVGGHGESYPIAGGPPPGKGSKGPGGHRAGITPPGHYKLGLREHHTTASWPMSTIPWGAKLRLRTDGEVEFSADGKHWKRATGKRGVVTLAFVAFIRRTPGTPRHLTPAMIEAINKQVLDVLVDARGKLRSTEWVLNDFGRWAWNLKTLAGKRTQYYIHTTPQDEADTAAGVIVLLEQSHGCVHVRPADRDIMMKNGYLNAGTRVQVRRYGTKGPP